MRGQEVRLDGVSITYPNGFKAVQPTDLVVRSGEFFSILGPSGCGKTTLLRAISGFVEPTEGNIFIGDQNQMGIGPNNRPTALIFQNLALFPLMSVAENVAFGLEARGVSKKARRKKAEALLNLVALDDQADKKPTELSGGQRQRVAIARALAVEPAVLLLDEPLSALDLKLRQHMRAELRAIQEKIGVTFIYITHDQGEALTMSDRIAVMNEGRLEQIGSGDEVYSHPQTAFVASFVGEVNRFEGQIVGHDQGQQGQPMAYVETPLGKFLGKNPHLLATGDKAMVFVRPESMGFQLTAKKEPFGNQFHARLIRRDLEGAFVNLQLAPENNAISTPIAMHITNTGAPLAVERDSMTQIGFSCNAAIVLPVGPVARTGREESLRP